MSMYVTSTGIKEDGFYEDKFGFRGSEENNYSVPFEIHNAPEGTVSFAVFLEDRDAVPPTGFSWIHWTIANLKRTEVKENESGKSTDFIEGVNSDCSKLVGKSREEATGYTGFGPPDTIHEYELRVYALDTELDLEPGFYLNELFKAMRGHVIGHATLYGKYSN